MPLSSTAPPLPAVNVTLDTVRGRVESHWRRDTDNHTFAWAFTIPYGSTAIIDLPRKGTYELAAGVYNLQGIDLCDHAPHR